MTIPPPDPNIDWNNIGFKIRPVKFYVEYTFSEKDGWDSGKLVDGNKQIQLELLSTSLHYGQTCFEGLKAFRMANGEVRIFRLDDHAQRFQASCAAVALPVPPEQLFKTACIKAVQSNMNLVPPFSVPNASLYIRPFAFGSGSQIGLHPATVAKFLVLVQPVGGYYQTADCALAMGNPVKALILAHFDRAAPHGCGRVKVGGNYGFCLAPGEYSKKFGYACNLFLDPSTAKTVEEFNSSNFIALKYDAKKDTFVYVTPLSASVLPSVTNRSLAYIAKHKFNWAVEHRVVEFEELEKGEFSEVAACGTAVILTPVSEIHQEEWVPSSEKPWIPPNDALFIKHPLFDASVYSKLVKDKDQKPIIKNVIKVSGYHPEQPLKKEFSCLEKLYLALQAIQRGTDPDWATYGFHSEPICP